MESGLGPVSWKTHSKLNVTVVHSQYDIAVTALSQSNWISAVLHEHTGQVDNNL